MIKPEFEPKVFTFKYNTLKTTLQLPLILRIRAQHGTQSAVVFMPWKEVWENNWFFTAMADLPSITLPIYDLSFLPIYPRSYCAYITN